MGTAQAAPMNTSEYVLGTNPKGTAKAAVPLACGDDLVCNYVVAEAFVLAMAVYSSMLECSKARQPSMNPHR